MDRGTRLAQLFGSLLVTTAIVAVTIVVVTNRFGTTSAAERELQEERLEQREEREEERRERLKELREGRRD